MKSEFVLAFNEVLEEKQLPRDVIIQALESAMVSAYRKAVTASAAQHVEAKLDPETGRFVIYAEKEVVDSVVDNRTEVLLEEARKVDPNAEIGDMVIVESTPNDFGRVAAQTARQVIQQRIRDADGTIDLHSLDRSIREMVLACPDGIPPVFRTAAVTRLRTGETRTVRGERLLIGTAPGDCGWKITSSPAISRIHAEITFRGGRYYLHCYSRTVGINASYFIVS